MPENQVSHSIKQAKFIEALVDSNGVGTEAYKAISGPITHKSAGVGASRLLKTISQDDTKAILERVGCTKDAVLEGLWERMKKTKKVPEYSAGANVIAKIGGFYLEKDSIRDLMDSGLDLVEIVKVRLRKSNDNKELKQTIDVSCTPKEDLVQGTNSDGTATEKDIK